MRLLLLTKILFQTYISSILIIILLYSQVTKFNEQYLLGSFIFCRYSPEPRTHMTRISIENFLKKDCTLYLNT